LILTVDDKAIEIFDAPKFSSQLKK